MPYTYVIESSRHSIKYHSIDKNKVRYIVHTIDDVKHTIVDPKPKWIFFQDDAFESVSRMMTVCLCIDCLQA